MTEFKWRLDMTRMVRRAMLCSVASFLIPGAAMAQPSIFTSTQPTGLVIRIVSQANPPDPNGLIQYTIRDASNMLVPNSIVVLDFAACGYMQICSSSVYPGLAVDCTGGKHRVTGTTGQFGRVSFVVAGAGTGTGPLTTGPCVQVRADNVPFSSLTAATLDYDDNMGVNGSDIGAFAADYFGGTNYARSDFDGNHVVNGIDLGFLAVSVFGNWMTSCATLCP